MSGGLAVRRIVLLLGTMILYFLAGMLIMLIHYPQIWGR